MIGLVSSIPYSFWSSIFPLPLPSESLLLFLHFLLPPPSLRAPIYTAQIEAKQYSPAWPQHLNTQSPPTLPSSTHPTLQNWRPAIRDFHGLSASTDVMMVMTDKVLASPQVY
jgi:hypothetical protein